MLYEVVVEDVPGAWFKHHGSAEHYAEWCANGGLRVYFQLVEKIVEEENVGAKHVRFNAEELATIVEAMHVLSVVSAPHYKAAADKVLTKIANKDRENNING